MKKLMLFLFVSGISFCGFSQAGFTIDGSSGCAPLCSLFSDTTSNAQTWLWDFGDASQGSMQQYAYHCYINPGVYTVTLNVTFASGSGTATGTVTVYANPVANFTSVNVGNNTVNFTDQSSGAASWYWYFGDGIGTSTQQNPSYTYSSSGNYPVDLVVVSADGCVDTTQLFVTPTGIHDYTNSIGWTIFPNPGNGIISIHFENTLENPEMIRVENTLGELIFQKEISDDATLDLSNQSVGIYFVRVGNSSVKKLLVE
jgi:uncharacterized membrane protein